MAKDVAKAAKKLTPQRPMTLNGWQRGGKWIQFDEHPIFCRVNGEGEPLVMLHGFPTSSWDYHRIWAPLTEHYQCITLDFLGFGFSDKPSGYDYRISEQADLVEGLIAGLGLKEIHVLAHNYGCSVTLELLARQQEGRLPFRLRSLCFMNGALFPETHQPVMMQRILLSRGGGLVARLLSQRVFELNMRRIFGHGTQPDKALLENYWELLNTHNGRGVLHRVIRYMEERRCHRHRWVGALQKSDLPCKLIWGMSDPVSGRPMVHRYQELIRQPDVLAMDEIGHFPHLEAPERVITTYLQFRDGLKKRRRKPVLVTR